MVIHRLTSEQRGNGQLMRNRFFRICLWMLVTGSTVGCGVGEQADEEVVVFAAASLQTAMQDVATTFQEEHGIAVRLNFAPSGSLAQQIMAGGRADVFVSASQAWIDEISTAGHANDDAKKRLMSNTMVMVANSSTEWGLESIEQLRDLPFRYLLIGDPEFVPAGKYAKRFLQSSIDLESGVSLWDSVDGRICPTSDLRRVLALVDSDVSLIGIVYATDVVGLPGVRVIHRVPKSEAAVDYFAVPLNSSTRTRQRGEKANRFLDYLFSESSSRVFDQLGFRVPAE